MPSIQDRAQPISLHRPFTNRGEGPRGYPFTFDMTNVNSTLGVFDLSTIYMEFVKSLFIDNSANSRSATFAIPGLYETIVIPPYSQAFFPVIQRGTTFEVNVSTTGGVAINVILLNIDIIPLIWAVSTPAGAATTTVASATGTFTNSSGSITAGGTSQQALAANTARKRLYIQNPSTAAGQNVATAESLFLRFGATAAGVADGQSIELTPGGSLDTGFGPPTTQAVQIIAATTNHRFAMWEM